MSGQEVLLLPVPPWTGGAMAQQGDEQRGAAASCPVSAWGLGERREAKPLAGRGARGVPGKFYLVLR